jgi:hypothetical protein
MSYRPQQQHGHHVGPPPHGGGGGRGGDGHHRGGGGGGYHEGQRRSGGDGHRGGGGGRHGGDGRGGGGRGGGGGGKVNVWVQTRPELEHSGLMVRTNCFALVPSVVQQQQPQPPQPTIIPVHQYLIQITSLRSQSDEQDRKKRIGFKKSTKPFFILDQDDDMDDTAMTTTMTTTTNSEEAQLKNRSTILTRRILQYCQLKFGLSLMGFLLFAWFWLKLLNSFSHTTEYKQYCYTSYSSIV